MDKIGVSAGFASLLLLAACVSSGTMVTEQQAAQFDKGIATRSQVITKLGQPNASTVMNDGSRIDVYMHVQAAANAASYVPVVGLMAGGANGSSNSVTFTYGPDGVLKSTSATSSQTHVNTGLMNQQ